MGKINLLDCTLRDGGYVNDWLFGEGTIKGFVKKIEQTGVEFCEVGFIKGGSYNSEKSVFPDTESFKNVILPKSSNVKYVGMLDMSAPVPIERFSKYDGSSIDGVRVIFKKDKADQAFEYCKKIKELGYMVFVNFVGTDLYTDKEFIEGIERFNTIQPYAMSIVDTFGLIKRKQFLRLVYIADNNMGEGIALCYHGHNNLQQAFGNAEALVELNLKRDVCIDACVFGMGRGAGNLNLELFADFMNENYNTKYKIEPMLEIMDEYLNEIFKTKFWGYSLPLYLSAVGKCHPNYAIHLANKNSLTVKGFSDLLRGMSQEDKIIFSKDKAEKYYKAYQENFIDDKETLKKLSEKFSNKSVLLLAPGKTLSQFTEQIKKLRAEKNAIVLAVNFNAEDFSPDFVFSSNMRRYVKMQENENSKRIITSNIKDCQKYDYMVNFSNFSIDKSEIIDNSGLMALKLLNCLDAKEVLIAGMDGYSTGNEQNYFDEELNYDFSKEAEIRNMLISEEIEKLTRNMTIEFITPSIYKSNS